MTSPFNAARAKELAADHRALPGGLHRRTADQLEAAAGEIERWKGLNEALKEDNAVLHDERSPMRTERRLAIAERDALRAELEAYKRAKAENDERFMIERDEARARLAVVEPVLAKAQQWRLYPSAPGAIAELQSAIDAALFHGRKEEGK